MSQEDWSRFLPQFKKKTTSKRKKPHEVTVKKSYTPFPPAPVPSKIDLQLDSGEYFLNEQQREAKKKAEKRTVAKERSVEKKKEREEEFQAPAEDEYQEVKKAGTKTVVAVKFKIFPNQPTGKFLGLPAEPSGVAEKPLVLKEIEQQFDKEFDTYFLLMREYVT